MSLIQEALEKAGRLKPVEKETRPHLPKEASPVPITSKTDPLWQVKVKVKLLGLFDKMRISPARRGEPGKSAFMAATLILLFLGAVLYVHNTALKSPGLNDSRMAASLDAGNPDSRILSDDNHALDFELTGITLSGNTRLALINDQVAGVGETLKEGATVLEIQNQRVILDFQGKRIELEL